jgi:hypothetical protein
MSDGADNIRVAEADLRIVSAADRAELMDIFRYAGMRRDLFVCGRPGAGGEVERDATFIARLTRMPGMPVLVTGDYLWQTKLPLAEV